MPQFRCPICNRMVFTGHNCTGDATELGKPIKDVVDNKQGNVFHLARNNALFPLLRTLKGKNSTQQVKLDSNFQSVLTTILLETVYSDPGALEPPGHPNRATLLATPISEFNKKTREEQYQFLDTLWSRCYKSMPPETLADAMIDSSQFSDGSGQLTSSLKPRDINNGNKVILDPGPVQDAWKKYHIGFRVDGAKGPGRNDAGRITSEGCRPLAANNALALQVVKKAYLGTKVAKGLVAFYGYQNRDMYNESVTCVSRSLLGSTAFPYRWTGDPNYPDYNEEKALEFRYLWALNCTGLKGIDTEQMQLTNKAPWRPGEKGFIGIPDSAVLGWTKLKRHGFGLAEGWAFTFVDCNWNWINKPSQQIADYLDAELKAWKPGLQYNILGRYDFQS